MVAEVIVERDVMVEMRDGVRLSTDVYRPGGDRSHSVLVQRTPYSKSNSWFVGGLIFNPLDAAQRGYVVIVQDTRGRFGSEGDWEPFVNEGADGYDTIEWAAAQPWSNGNVGIYGSSYMGVTTTQALVAAPPHLKAGLAYVTGSDYHNGWTYSGGAFELGFNLWWTNFLGWDTATRLKVHEQELNEILGRLAGLAADPWAGARHLPLKDIAAFEDEVAPYWQKWFSHPTYDDYWARVDVAARADQVQAPLLQIAAWYDNFLRGQIELHEKLQGRGEHRIVIGPWDHEAYLSLGLSTSGERDFGPVALSGPAFAAELAFQWFDHWLEGKDTGTGVLPNVRYFATGANEWREAPSWPPTTTSTHYFLHSGGRANTRHGDGMLTSERAGSEAADGFRYDPKDPVPSTGGRTLHPAFGPGGIQDQSEVEERKDVLVYTSGLLTGPVTVAGKVGVTLYAASSAPDTDFTAKLVDVEPGGYCANIAEGIVRARYRSGDGSETLLIPGEATEFHIDLWDVAHIFKEGHRIRLEISSSNFPRFSRNLNSEVSPEVGAVENIRDATQQVLHDAEHPSHLTLPLV
jgi:putative CocE/NonD family hydrolase